jgi:drug/metabolite transporter (DMT)-like permease
VLSAVAYSASAVLGKDLLDSLRPHEMLFWRFTLAAPVCWVLLAVRRHGGGLDPMVTPKQRVRLAGVGALFALMSLTGFVALDHLDASLYIVLVYVYPAFVAIVSPFLGHPVRRLVWVAFALTLPGIVCTVPDVFTGDEGISTFGVVMTLVQAVVLAGYVLVSSRLTAGSIDGFVMIGWSLIGSWTAMAALVAAFGVAVPSDTRTIVELVGFATVPTIVSGACFFQAMRHLPPAIAAMIATLEPPLTVVWAIAFLDERLRPIQLVGGALVVGGAVLAQRAAGPVDAPLNPVP